MSNPAELPDEYDPIEQWRPWMAAVGRIIVKYKLKTFEEDVEKAFEQRTLALDLLERCQFTICECPRPYIEGRLRSAHKPDCALAQLLERNGRTVTWAKSD